MLQYLRRKVLRHLASWGFRAFGLMAITGSFLSIISCSTMVWALMLSFSDSDDGYDDDDDDRCSFCLVFLHWLMAG